MKKTYSTPIIEIEKFDVIDVLTTSAGTTDTAIDGVIKQNGSTYEVEIVSQW